MIKVLIDRATWWRGNGDAESSLRRADDTKCCLGFAALACGYTEEQIEAQPTPAELVKEVYDPKQPDQEYDLWPDKAVRESFDDDLGRKVFLDTQVIQDMMAVNDFPLTGKTMFAITQRVNTEEDRERVLTELAAQVGLEFEFTGEGHPRPEPTKVSDDE